MDKIKLRVYQLVVDPPEGDRLGNAINVGILILIAINVTVGLLETVKGLEAQYKTFFYWFEFASVMIFTVEYLLRLWSCTAIEEYKHPIRGRIKISLAPMAIIDLLAILPFYLQVFAPGLDLRFVRVLRLLRLFRLFRFGRVATSFRMLGRVMKGKREELFISLAVLMLVLILASNIMYIIEHNQPNSQFTSVPAAMWWGMITITTIGYGDMVPMTPLGRAIGMLVAFLGVCVFALPVAILGAGFVEEIEQKDKLKEEYKEEFEAEQAERSIDKGDLSPLPQMRLTEQQMDQLAEKVAAHLARSLNPPPE